MSRTKADPIERALEITRKMSPQETERFEDLTELIAGMNDEQAKAFHLVRKYISRIAPRFIDVDAKPPRRPKVTRATEP